MQKHIDNDLCAIIVTYNPDVNKLIFNINNYIDAFKEIYIIDNSEKTIDFNFIMSHEKIKLFRLKSNFGIAYAQNIGIKLFLKSQFDYCVLFDQDSTMSSAAIMQLLSTAQNGTLNKIGLVGPSITPDGNGLKEVSQTLSSGSLIHRDVLKKVGSMDEDLFIDLVDFEWCWRASSMGYNIYINQDIYMNHQLGEGKFFVFGIPVPIRHYYQYRNSIILIKRKSTPMKFKIRCFFVLPIKYLFFSLFFKDRKERIKYINRGILDGFKNKKGKYTYE